MHYIDKFLEYEKRKELLNKNINGFYFWGYLRFTLYSEILNKKENLQDHRKMVSKRDLFKSLFLNIFRHNPFVGNKNIDLLVLPHNRKIKNGEYFECIYTDPIIRNLEDSEYIVFESAFEGKHYKNLNNNVRYLDLIDIVGYVGAKLIRKKEVIELINIEIKKIIKDLDDVFGISIDENKILTFIQTLYKRWLIQRILIEKLITRFKPKCIIEVVYYSLSNMIVNEIANDLKITTIELQHGTMGKYHAAYNYSEKVRLPYLPNKMFLFSDYWKANTKLPQSEDNLIVTGFPYIDNKIIEIEHKSKEKVGRSKKTILFISQLTIGELLSKFACEFIDRIKGSTDYKIIYKLHNSEFSTWRERYPWLVAIEDQIEIIDDNDRSIYEFFRISDIQIGVYSTAIFEGLAFNLKTFLVDSYGIEYMHDLIKSQYATLINSPCELIEKLSLDDLYTGNRSEFWKLDSTVTILENLDSIMKS
ncbi:hypothetical protein QBE52_02780 [Clostridiaceae bacterium 35-E11]